MQLGVVGACAESRAGVVDGQFVHRRRQVRGHLGMPVHALGKSVKERVRVRLRVPAECSAVRDG